MHGKNNSDEKTSPVNRDKMANEATRVIDDPGLPPQPGPVARPPLPPPPPAPPPAADFGLVAQRQPLHETRVESAEPRTRFIGAYASEPAPATPDKKMTPHAHAPTAMAEQGPVVGWLVVIGGHGRGRFRSIGEGSNPIGRSPSQRIPLDFGDDTISSEKQAYLIYDPQQRDFLLVPNLERSNLVSLNNTRVTQPMPLKAGDIIAMGQTKLYFQPLCGPTFDWNDPTTKPPMMGA